MSKTDRRVGLRQVAQRAGVSLSTASNVFADKPGVSISDETRNAVLAAATELKYQPRPRQEVVQLSNVTRLGAILRKPLPLLTSPFYANIIHGIQEACEARGISLMYGRVDETVSSLDELPTMIQRKEIQGVLTIGYFDESFFLLLRRLEQPFVMIDHLIESLQPDSVICDDEQGGYLATQYLIEHGHRQPAPATIAGPANYFSSQARLAGYRRAMAAYNLPIDEAVIRYGDLTVNAGYSEMLALLDLPHPPTAVFCGNDEMAIGAMNALQMRGLRVPEDCSIIGFDDIQLAPYAISPLTTIRVEKEWMGAQGVWQLIERITHPDMPARRTIMNVKLIERQSVQSLPANSPAALEAKIL